MFLYSANYSIKAFCYSKVINIKRFINDLLCQDYMSDLSNVLCSEMKRLYKVDLSFEGGLVSFKTANAYRPGTDLGSVDLFLSSQKMDNEEKFYLIWEDNKENQCLHIATVFSDSYDKSLPGILEAALLHIKNLYSFVERAKLPESISPHVNIRHLDLLYSSKKIPLLGAKFIGGTRQDRLRTLKTFYL